MQNENITDIAIIDPSWITPAIQVSDVKTSTQQGQSNGPDDGGFTTLGS